MLIEIDSLKINVETEIDQLNHKIPIVFLHGFCGSTNDWHFVKNKIDDAFTPIFIDLIGFGKSSKPEEPRYYSEAYQLQILKNIFEKLNLENFILAGYSMGGRIASAFVCSFPHQVKSLILESSSFGLRSEKEKSLRIKNDEKIISIIEKSSLKIFFDFWYNQEIFGSLKSLRKDKFEALLKSRLETNNKTGMINSLKMFGTGKMSYNYDCLQKFKGEVLLISGEKDKKYSRLFNQANQQLLSCTHKIISDCGHNVHLQKPEEFLKLLNTFLANFKGSK